MKSNFFLKWKTTFFVFFIFLAAFLGYQYGRRESSFSFSRRNYKASDFSYFSDFSEKNYKDLDFSLFWDVWKRLESYYLKKDSIVQERMYYGAIKGLVDSLGDPYTFFLSPGENKQAKDDLNGEFEGIGIQLGYNKDKLAVIAPLKGTPAEKEGIRAGDLILKIEEKDTAGINLSEAVSLIRGPKGTKIKLTILHTDSDKPIEMTITRDTIIVPSVELDIDKDGVAVIKLTRFGDKTNEEWKETVEKILGNGKMIKGVILDLRNNPGGYLNGAVFIASEFLEKGVVVQQEGSNGVRETFSVNRQGELTKIKLVVLVNKESASASEAGLHITTARWLLPKGRSIDKEGIKPDIEVKDVPETETDEQLERAKQILISN